MEMASFLSMTNSLLRRVFTVDIYSVTDVRVSDYVHWNIIEREESIILHSCEKEANITSFEIVLYRENQTSAAFSLYRSNDHAEALQYFQTLKERVPVLIRHLPQLANASQLFDICRYIRLNPSQNIGHICAYFGYVDYFKLLLAQKNDEDPSTEDIINLQDDNGKTPLHVAVECQRFPVVELIVNLCPYYDIVDSQENNVLHFAASTNRDIISTICVGIQNRNTVQQESNEITTMLSESLYKLINARNSKLLAPLYVACESDKPDCVKELLKYGADVNGASICDSNHPRRDDSFDSNVMRQLNDRDMKNGGTLLHWCKSAEVIEVLVDMNCNINAKNFHGDTALHIMIRRGNLSSIVMLLSHSAQVNAVGQNGETPLHLAVKTGDVSIVQAVLVFGAQVDVQNSSGETPRHLAATSQAATKEVLLYMLHAVGASRCQSRRSNCNEGCAQDYGYNGLPPENRSFIRDVRMFDKLLMESIIKEALQKCQTPEPMDGEGKSKRKKVNLLSMDGGGIRGLIIVQVLAVLEDFLGKPIVEVFDWFGGTSTGAILALLLASGRSARECREIYFRLKDKIFVGFRPYSSEVFESFLKKYLGDRKMNDITNTRVMVTATVGDRFPPDIKIFRNYLGPNELLKGCKHDAIPELKTQEEPLWKVARASGAAPTYFSQFESFLDGGLISNNPTMDMMTDVQNLNKVYENLKMNEQIVDIGLVMSIGTGNIPRRNMEPVNFASLTTLSGISSLASNFNSLLKVLVEQASQADGAVVERAQAWCSMIKVPYFRISPPISEDLPLDESRNVQLVQILWETMHYLHTHKSDLQDLMILLMSESS